MPTPHLYFAILEACSQPGCLVCRMAHQAGEHLLETFLYENVNDPALRQPLRRSLGFCNRHAWQLLEIGDVLGVVILYHDVLGTVLKNLPEEVPQEGSQGWLPTFLKSIPRSLSEKLAAAIQALTPRAPCPACEQESNTAQTVLSELMHSLEKKELISALAASDGLCLPHIKEALQYARKENDLAILLSIHRTKLEGLRAELAEFIRKSDYRFRHEALGSERDAGYRAVRLAAGERQVNPPR